MSLPHNPTLVQSTMKARKETNASSAAANTNQPLLDRITI